MALFCLWLQVPLCWWCASGLITSPGHVSLQILWRWRFKIVDNWIARPSTCQQFHPWHHPLRSTGLLIFIQLWEHATVSPMIFISLWHGNSCITVYWRLCPHSRCCSLREFLGHFLIGCISDPVKFRLQSVVFLNWPPRKRFSQDLWNLAFSTGPWGYCSCDWFLHFPIWLLTRIQQNQFFRILLPQCLMPLNIWSFPSILSIIIYYNRYCIYYYFY